MLKLKKSKFALALSVLICCCMVFCATAIAKETSLPNKPQATIYSEEFPDALVKYEYIPTTRSANLIGQVAATVYYEEEYREIGDETLCVKSRLLPKEEVEAIGVNQFNGVILRDVIAPSKSSKKGTLTIRLFVYNIGNNSYNLVGDGQWSGSFSATSSTEPAFGDDFIGLTWGGQFDYSNESAYATNNYGQDVSVYEADSTPNVGYVWQFNEGASDREGLDWVTQVNCSLDIFKETLTGNGNTTSFVLKYIHTYQSVSGGISVSTSGAGFSLGSVEKQWGLVANLSSFKY